MTFPIRRCALAALLAVALAPGAAMAQNAGSGFYASIAGAYAIPVDSKISETVEGHTASSDLEAKGGIAFLVAAGYGVSENMNVELELGYRRFSFSKFKGLKVSGPTINGSLDGSLPVKGSIGTLSLMANGLVSFDIWKLKPYVGAGVGVARHSGKLDRQSIAVGNQTFEYSGASEDDYVFAYQVMAGLGYPLSDTAEVRAGYRYFATSKADFDGTEATYGTHNFEAGILFRF